MKVDEYAKDNVNVLVAQLVELSAFNRKVWGSNPHGDTYNKIMVDINNNLLSGLDKYGINMVEIEPTVNEDGRDYFAATLRFDTAILNNRDSELEPAIKALLPDAMVELSTENEEGKDYFVMFEFSLPETVGE